MSKMAIVRHTDMQTAYSLKSKCVFVGLVANASVADAVLCGEGNFYAVRISFERTSF